MTNTSLQTFDVTEHIRGKIREVLIGSIPDEQMDAMIKGEVDRYFNQTGGGFYALVKSTLDEVMREDLRKWMGDAFRGEWRDGYFIVAGDIVRKLAPAALEGIAAAVTSRILQNIKSGY